MSKIVISKVCPSCAAADFKKVRSKRWIAFSDDRICNQCRTRFWPPTPWWAGMRSI